MTGKLLHQLWHPSASTLSMALVTLLALLLCFSAVRISHTRNAEQDLEALKAKLEHAGQTYMALSRQINDALSLQMEASARYISGALAGMQVPSAEIAGWTLMINAKAFSLRLHMRRLQLEWQETLLTLKQLAQEWKKTADVSGVAR